MTSVSPRILYCHCTYAQTVPSEVKATVLRRLCESGLSFEAVADLCELAARRDPLLNQLAEGGGVKIAACYPRAVKWLFAAAQAPLLTVEPVDGPSTAPAVPRRPVESAARPGSVPGTSPLLPAVPGTQPGPHLRLHGANQTLRLTAGTM